MNRYIINGKAYIESRSKHIDCAEFLLLYDHEIKHRQNFYSSKNKSKLRQKLISITKDGKGSQPFDYNILFG